MSYHYLLDLALILVSTKLLGLLTQRFQMPQVVGAPAGWPDPGPRRPQRADGNGFHFPTQ